MKISRPARLRLAAILWIAVAAMLIYRGLVPHFGNVDGALGKILALALGVVVGGAKGVFVLTKSAARTARFIAARPEKDWFWLSLHPILYVLIPVMIAMGWGLRELCKESAPGVVVGVYVGIGAALLGGLRGFRGH